MAQGDFISAVDYNAIHEKIIQILGTGVGTIGYGQIVRSAPVSPGEIITKGTVGCSNV